MMIVLSVRTSACVSGLIGGEPEARAFVNDVSFYDRPKHCGEVDPVASPIVRRTRRGRELHQGALYR